MIAVNDLTYVVDQTVSALFYDELFSQPLVGPALYRMSSSSTASETRASLSGGEAWSQKAEGSDIDEATVENQFKKTFTHTAFGQKYVASRELIDDNQWGILERIAMYLADGAILKMEKDAVSVFNDAFAGALFQAEDGLSLCNGAHLNAAGGNSQDNDFTHTLNFAGLQANRKHFKQIKNYRGELMGAVMDEILVPDDLEEKGWELQRSIGKPEGANNEPNFFNNGFKLYVWSRLTDTNAWFAMASRLRERHLEWIMRIAPETFGDGSLFNGTRKLGGYMRYSLGPVDWRFIAGNNPS